MVCILNLGCGTKVSTDPSVVNIDFSIALRVKRNVFLRPFTSWIFRGDRLKQYSRLGENVLVHDLRKGIPFGDASVDVVYHSHLFEHIDRSLAGPFLKENRRVLKNGGIVRIVVPNFAFLCQNYIANLAQCVTDPTAVVKHDGYIAKMIAQCVQREASGTQQQRPLRRAIENLVLGDARKRGQTHQWMYDTYTLTELLYEAGFSQVREEACDSSRIGRWSKIGLDIAENGIPHKSDSLYIEAIK